MKHRLFLFLLPLVTFLLRLIGWTMRVRLIDPQGLSPTTRKEPSLIYAFWHNQQLLASFFFRNLGIRVLVSRSQDGDYIARALESFGFSTVRSSTSSGKLNALRGMVRELKSGHHVAITPDGPRGPVYQAQPGAIFLSLLTGHTIAPFGCAVDRVWKLRSWDQFEIPKPFSRAVIIFGEELAIPGKRNDEQIQEWVRRLQQKLVELRNQAKELVIRDGKLRP